MRTPRPSKQTLEEFPMFYESGIYPLFVADPKSTNPDEGPIQTGGEIPPPPPDPPRV